MQSSNKKKECLNPLEDEGRSKCEFTMIVAQRKIQFKTDSRQKKRQNYVVMKLNCKNVFVKSTSDYTRKFKHMKLL
jgi:hypothetical protein